MIQGRAPAGKRTAYQDAPEGTCITPVSDGDTAAMRLASPSRRPLDLVSEVNGQRTGVRRARAQQEVRRWPLVEQARAGAQDRGHKVQAELVNRAGREVLAGHVRAAVDQHVV